MSRRYRDQDLNHGYRSWSLKCFTILLRQFMESCRRRWQEEISSILKLQKGWGIGSTRCLTRSRRRKTLDSFLNPMPSANHLSHVSKQGERVCYLEKLNQTDSTLKTPGTVGDTYLIENSRIKWKFTYWTVRHKVSYSHWATRNQTVR